jgi:hypothetical protein
MPAITAMVFTPYYYESFTPYAGLYGMAVLGVMEGCSRKKVTDRNPRRQQVAINND